MNWLQSLTLAAGSFTFSVSVPVIVRLDLVRHTETIYTVHEVSNNPKGYQVVLTTDAMSGSYDGKSFIVADGKVVLTNVTHQDESINVFKVLTINQSGTNSTIVIIRLDD